MYIVILSSKYRKSFKKVTRHKDFNQSKLEEVVQILASGSKLDQKYRDHALSGNFNGAR